MSRPMLLDLFSGGGEYEALAARLAEAEAAVVTARERAEALEAAVRALPGAAWNSFDGDGKRLDWLVERSAVLALLTRADQ